MKMVAKVKFTSYEESVYKALDLLNLDFSQINHQRIVVKPNLVTEVPYPTTSHPKFIKAICDYFKERCQNSEIIIAESTPNNATKLFHKHGLDKIGYRCVDLDKVDYYVSFCANAPIKLYNLIFYYKYIIIY